MKKTIKIVLTGLLALSPAIPPPASQPGAELPSEQAYTELQTYAKLPSESDYLSDGRGDLRADRPIDETPIGGLSAPLPGVSIPALLLFALAANAVRSCRRKTRQEATRHPLV
jgi:hypothetical protein